MRSYRASLAEKCPVITGKESAKHDSPIRVENLIGFAQVSVKHNLQVLSQRLAELSDIQSA
jgi:hypothetical protein